MITPEIRELIAGANNGNVTQMANITAGTEEL